MCACRHPLMFPRRFTRLLVLLGALLAGSFATPSAGAIAAPSAAAFVRVDQIGYASQAGKRAYLLATSDDAGARFQIRRVRGGVVYRGVIGGSLGRWNRRLRYV